MPSAESALSTPVALSASAAKSCSAVQAQTITLHRAYEQARGHTPPTPLDALKRAWNRASREDRRQFLQSLSRGLLK